MISDPTLNLSIAHSHIARMRAQAADERLARTAGTTRTSRRAAFIAALRRLAGAATLVTTRRHPAGKAA